VGASKGRVVSEIGQGQLAISTSMYI
jgi:hypothetical protein